ncbi:MULTISPECIES: HD domain-containing protein [Clostridium]|uniref:HD domain-containing protein n=1 Tax=Clostridium TaxID=1485 RepID=UPI0007EE4879|nr:MULTISPECIES: HD domain-containing protein [Clostridium]QXE19877.1 hypothetical protein B5S50_14180 [Clostridium sp. 001]
MKKVNAILKNRKFCTYLSKINKLEENRKYCKHSIQHLLDVARITYIKVLEQNIHVEKEIIYAAALLHDIGRWQQYEEGIPHELASIKLGKDILDECGFDNEEENEIFDLISNHRKKNSDNLIQNIFYDSDKACRNCFMCKSISDCNWPDEKKNYSIKY